MTQLTDLKIYDSRGLRVPAKEFHQILATNSSRYILAMDSKLRRGARDSVGTGLFDKDGNELDLEDAMEWFEQHEESDFKHDRVGGELTSEDRNARMVKDTNRRRMGRDRYRGRRDADDDLGVGLQAGKGFQEMSPRNPSPGQTGWREEAADLKRGRRAMDSAPHSNALFGPMQRITVM